MSRSADDARWSRPARALARTNASFRRTALFALVAPGLAFLAALSVRSSPVRADGEAAGGTDAMNDVPEGAATATFGGGCQKNPIRYKLYRTACGRDRRLEEVWGATS